MATREDEETPKKSPLKFSIVLGTIALALFTFSQTDLPIYFWRITNSMIGNEELLYKTTGTPQTTSSGNNVSKILLSEIFTGDDSFEPFIELYNPANVPANLTGFSIKKLTTSGEEITFLSPKRLGGLAINPHGYFLITRASSTMIADAYWPKSYNLTKQNSGLSLYNSFGEQADNVSWKTIPTGASLARIAWNNNEFSFTNFPTPQATAQSVPNNN